MYSKSLTKEIAKFKASCTSRERNSYYAVLYEGGLGITDSTICFAASGRMPSGGLYFLNMLMHSGVTRSESSRKKYHKDLVKFYDLLFNESIWADVFITKSGEEYVSEGVLVARTDVPSNLLIQGMQAARIPTEYSNTMWAFIDLVDAGVNAKLAFAISMCVRGGDYRNGTIDFSSSSTNHQCLEPDYFYSGTLKNMYEGAFTELKPFKVCTNYRKDISLARMWEGGGGDNLKSFIEANFKPEEILGEVAKKSISLNPFKRVEDKPSTTYKFDYKRAIKAMAIFAKTIEEDFVNA